MASTNSLERLLQQRWVSGLLVFVAAFAVYAPTVSTAVSTDVAATSLTSWQIAQTGQPWMEELDLSAKTPIPYYGPGTDGHTVTTRSPGPTWAGVPFYLGSSPDQDDLSFERSGLGAAALTAAAVAMMFLALRTRMTPVAALGASAVFALATPMWSVSADALWPHTVTGFGIASAAWALSRDRWWEAGAWFGIALFGRPHVALVAAVVGLGMALSRRSPKIAVRIGVSSAMGLVVLLVWNRYVFDRWDVRSGYAASADALVPGLGGGWAFLENLAGFLVAPDRGFLVWTPLAALLLPAVVRMWSESPQWSRWLAVGGMVYTLAQVEVNDFTGGDAFYSYRLGIELLVCLTPLYAFSLAGAGRFARRMAPTVAGLQLAAISLGSIVDGLYIHQDLAWVDNSLLVALRNQPLVVGIYLVVVAVVGARLTSVWVSRSERKDVDSPRVRIPSRPRARP